MSRRVPSLPSMGRVAFAQRRSGGA
ncbi:MAG: hypothetical protein FD124_3036, partial [Alphaproteobacteria bacterium]